MIICLDQEKSNKTIFLMGDFNIYLLSYEHHTETNNFINSISSHYLLLYILNPTSVTDHSSTAIDNIFSNVTEYETISDNIINQIVDHFGQFLLLKRININYKNSNFYQYNYSNCNKEISVEEFSNINWNKLENAEEDVDSKFTFFCNEFSRCAKTPAPLTTVSPKALSFRNKP